MSVPLYVVVRDIGTGQHAHGCSVRLPEAFADGTPVTHDQALDIADYVHDMMHAADEFCMARVRVREGR